ncbi:MAG: hypothetical protein ACYCS4_07985 [Acidimicrobiales bacterium]
MAANVIRVQNDKQRLVATNAWDEWPSAREFLCSINAGCIRLLLGPKATATHSEILAFVESASVARFRDGFTIVLETPSEARWFSSTDEAWLAGLAPRPLEPWTMAVYGPGPKQLSRLVPCRVTLEDDTELRTTLAKPVISVRDGQLSFTSSLSFADSAPATDLVSIDCYAGGGILVLLDGEGGQLAFTSFECDDAQIAMVQNAVSIVVEWPGGRLGPCILESHIALTDTSVLGVPGTEAELAELVRQIAPLVPPVRGIEQWQETDERLVKAMRRWQHDPPDKLTIADLVPMRSAAVRKSQAALPTAQPAQHSWEVAQIQALYGGRHYWLDAPVVATLATAEPPDQDVFDQVRLPYPVSVVWFDGGVAIPSAALQADRTRWHMAYPQADSLLWDEPPHSELYLAGVILYARDGHPLPGVGWMLRTPVPPWKLEVLPGTLSKPSAAHLAHGTAACLAWGHFRDTPSPPDRLPSPEDRRGWDEVAKRSKWRHAVERGSLLGLRILDIQSVSDHPDHHSSSASNVPADRHIAPHLRRGHWRNVRVGPRSNWHYEARLITPTWVHGRSPAARSVVVLRIAQ